MVSPLFLLTPPQGGFKEKEKETHVLLLVIWAKVSHLHLGSDKQNPRPKEAAGQAEKSAGNEIILEMGKEKPQGREHM